MWYRLEDKMNDEDTANERATNMYEYRITWTNAVIDQVQAYGDSYIE